MSISLCSDNFRRTKHREEKYMEKVLWWVCDGVKAAWCLFSLINESKHQTGYIPQVNPNSDTQSGVISPRCKYLLCNKRGNSSETDNYLLLWRWQNTMSLTMCNWWLFHRASRLIWMCFCLLIYLSPFLPCRAWTQTELWLRQTGSLHVTGVQSDPLSTLFIKWRSSVSEV